MYKRKPVGDYHVGVCTNTLCAVMGGDAIFERLKDHLDVGNDETTDDGKITLEHVECNAACDYAPVMMVNWEFMDNMTPESATQLVDDLRAGKRGPARPAARAICTWREAERVLAGFPDGLADEGPAAGPASLVGLGIARENGWTRRPTYRRRARQPKVHRDDTLTPVLTDNWDADRALDARVVRGPRRLRRAEEGARHGARTPSSRRSRTPACAAAAAPASRPA